MSQFHFVGRHSIYHLTLEVVNGDGDVVDADALPVVSFRNYATNAESWARATSKVADGTYRVTLSSLETANPGLWYVLWNYELDSVEQQYRSDIEIPSVVSSVYESLSPEYRAIVESVWDRFEDQFDSPIGGPHLLSYVQSSFGRERVSQLLGMALRNLNAYVQPHANYDMDNFPLDRWSGILEQATVVETIKHLIRSYIEQPTAQGIQAARLDRSAYASMWTSYLNMESAALSTMLGPFQVASMNMGRTSTLVAGGVYGEFRQPVRPTRPKPLGPQLRW